MGWLQVKNLFSMFKFYIERVSTEPPLFTGEKKEMSKQLETVYSAVSTARIKDG